MNTTNHETMPRPRLHKMLRTGVMIIVTKTLIKAVLYKPLNVSITICVREKAKYNNAGAQSFICTRVAFFARLT